MPKVIVDGIEVEVPEGSTVLQACEAAGKEIPRFCYHDRLSIAGNCRMCLVEVSPGPPKPQASCALPAMDNQEIKTNSEMVVSARKGVMEFLLINHPLDCPICDQGGECDLQDQAMGYGNDATRYLEQKRAVTSKEMGPLIKTIMTRCIHCTRCVRFSTEVAGVTDMGALGRGESMEITTYLEKALESELSGNVIDLCPVGALTSKPYSFVSRPWELKKTETIDVMDAIGSNIRVDTRGGEVLRVLPRVNEDINEEWISDKTRFSCDGLKRQRLDKPFVRKDGKLVPASWDEALSVVADKMEQISPEAIAVLVGDQCEAESMFALKCLAEKLGIENIDCRQDGAKINTDSRASYLFNSTIAGIEDTDAVLLIGTNPRWEAPVLNARIRKRWLETRLPIALIGEEYDLTYDVDYLGNSASLLEQILRGEHSFSKMLAEAKRPMLIVGMNALARADGDVVLGLCRKIAEQFDLIKEDKDDNESWNGFNVLHTAASRVAGLDMKFVPKDRARYLEDILDDATNGIIEMVYLMAADEIDMSRLGKAFVIYQGHHGDAGAHRADVILPGAAYTEKDGLYVNTEGRPQFAVRAVFPPGDAREDWRIVRALSDVVGVTLEFDTSEELHQRLIKTYKTFQASEVVQNSIFSDFGQEGEVEQAPFARGIKDFYMTDPISRASKVMAECSEVFGNSKNA